MTNHTQLQLFAASESDAVVPTAPSRPASSPTSKVERWRGVAYPPIVNGICTRHRLSVCPFTRLCFACHRDQLQAAARGSREHERLPRDAQPKRTQQQPEQLDIGAYSEHVRRLLEEHQDARVRGGS